ERPSGIAVILMGPTDLESQWSPVLAPGESVETVPVAIAQAVGGLDQGAAELTRYRRALRGSNGDRVVPLVFNDYMNTLVGDPTTEKLLPLIDAAAIVGAEYFCIDAGWYDDSGKWWDGVGEWRPSTTRFPGGLGLVISRIHERGMIPGLWLEPEVIGVKSPLADSLPISAFLTRGGERVELGGRYLLDFRSPATIAHLDAVVDRLVADFGLGFFKLDYNATPGAGSDAGGVSAGVGLLEHNRAVLAWLDAVRTRHPHLVIENCGSGAMRMDYAMLARLDLQSTSDQQDAVLYAAIAAAAPLSMIPEQAANWAYPQSGMTREEQVFALANGMLGALYLSGYLNRMSPEEVALVSEAVRIHKGLRSHIATSVPFWPLGLPSWDAEWVVLGLQSEGDRLLTVWHREGGPAAVDIPLAPPGTSSIDLTSVFPLDIPGWAFEWVPESGVLRASTTIAEPSARVIRITSQMSSPRETSR
ncbi:MAG: glycoside hydrolase family 36 protein, partial [Leifsonia sp.]